MGGDGFLSTVDGDSAALAALVSGARKLLDAELCKRSAQELLDYLRTVEELSRLIWAVQVRGVDEVIQRGLAAQFSATSTRVLLQQALRIPIREASARVRTAKATHPQDLPSGGETPTVLPVLAAAQNAGLVDPDHVQTTVAAMNHLPATLDPDQRADAEQALVVLAMDLDPDQYRKAAHHLVEVLDPDGTPDETEPSSRAELSIGIRSATTGLTNISGKLDDLGIETLRAAIDGLAAPRPMAEGVRDPRPASTRRAHALVEVLSRSLKQGDLPAHGGERPQVTVTLNWQLVQQKIGSAVLGSGETLTPGVARRLLCDAAIIPAVLDGESEVLDLGRAARTFNRATRRALALRDKGCAFPGCDRPPSYCDSHHVEYWQRDLGPTSYTNGCLLCAYHHTIVHQGEWRIEMAPDGVPEFIPPKWLDPQRRPRRNTVHQLAPDTS